MTRDLLFEIGVEELPGGYVPPALVQLEQAAREGLAGLRLAFDDLTTFGTPRRLALLVKDLADRQTDHDEEATGPAVRAAFDAEGKPTRALLGFCHGKGVDPSAVRRVQTAKGEYVAVTVHHAGRPAIEVLPAMLGALPARLTFPKSMRWIPGDDARFARPVRWLTALFGDEIVPARAFALEAGRTTSGHRFLASGTSDVATASRYLETLERASVLADHRARRLLTAERVSALAAAAGGRVVADEDLVDINNFLVEWPTAFTGRFDPKFLDLPREVIVTALREHQRYFAVESADGSLLPAFIAVRNGGEGGADRVRRGNEDVLASRLEDARFYWETDLKTPPANRLDGLANVVWMEGLGSLRDKASRLEALAAALAERLAPAAAATAKRAALLCKTDLLSEMIGSGKEYAGLQGTIGGYYAARAGEPREVAEAIAWHYHPRFAGDALPATDAGVVLSLADKLDHVAGAFVAGKAPSGSEDPYGVRRAGNGVVRILIEGGRHLDLRDATMRSTAPFFGAGPDLPQAALMKQLGEFWRGRVEAALEQEGLAYDTREAALEAQLALEGDAGDKRATRRPGWNDPADALDRARVLAAFRDDRRFEPLVILFKRVANILKAATEPLPETLDRAPLTEPAERDLLAALDRARERTSPLWQKRAYGEILPALLEMEQAIHTFFDKVMVNVEDERTRRNRLKLLADVRDLFLRGWDLSRIVVEGERA